MPTYYVDDGGTAPNDGSSWAAAYTSLSALDDAVTIAAGDIIYIGSDHVCQFPHSGNRTLTFPTSGVPVKVISASTADTTYAKSTTNQVDTSEGAYDLTISGNVTFYGVKFKVGDDFITAADSAARVILEDCTIEFSAGEDLPMAFDGTAKNLTIALTDSGATSSNVFTASPKNMTIQGLTITGASNRTGQIFTVGADSNIKVSGADFSEFTNAGVIDLLYPQNLSNPVVFNNCLMPASWNAWDSVALRIRGEIMLTNIGSADTPTYLAYRNYWGELFSSETIYRTGGATIETTATSWLVSSTTANCSEMAPFKTPWIYGEVASTGSKTFDVYITHDANTTYNADFTDAEVWLEVEYLGTTDEAITAVATDQRATITTTAAAQTDDTTSTWNGTGPSFTYKQKLSAPATVNETGMYRVRVCVGVASISSGHYFYIDPKVTVS